VTERLLRGELDMTRVALVTGGTRGIGAAISKALKAAGYKVAAFNTNLGSLFNMTRQVIEGMRARKFGRIVNISSINGQKGQFGQVNYSAAKAGDIGFTKALALENAKGGITVNVICPGYINTEMVQAVPKDVLEKAVIPQIPTARLGEPEEIARAVVFLAADDAGFITGSTLSINGGQYLI